MKICKNCLLEKDEINFYRVNKTGYIRAICKSCDYIRYRQYVVKNGQRFRGIKTLYGITEDEYQNLLEKQHHVCAICKGKNINERRLSVDHCHITGLIRGLLCFNCNVALGSFKENPKLLENALKYIKGELDV